MNSRQIQATQSALDISCGTETDFFFPKAADCNFNKDSNHNNTNIHAYGSDDESYREDI